MGKKLPAEVENEFTGLVEIIPDYQYYDILKRRESPMKT